MRGVDNLLDIAATKVFLTLPRHEQRVYLGARARMVQAGCEGKTTFRLRGRELRVVGKVTKAIEKETELNFKA